MNQAKIRLSEKEMELVSSPDFILTKNVVLGKAVSLLELLRDSYKEILLEKNNILPVEWLQSSSKIIKGENYLGLPYRVLDFPAIFSSSNILAIRTIFWWGNQFSITLHIAGTFKKKYENKLISAYHLLKPVFFVCIHKEQWHHHFEESNYTRINNLTEMQFTDIVMNKNFVKLATYLPVTDWNKTQKEMPEQFRHLLNIIVD